MPSGDAIQEIKEKLNIVDVVSPYVTLKKIGRNLKALCPFHTEKTPSFIVFPDKGNYHCFGCGANGDIFTFVARVEKVDFLEALRLLADRAGVTLRARRKDAAEEQRLERLHHLHAAAAQFFFQLLYTPAGQAAREYLERRAFSRETVEAFQLGYAPDSWEALSGHLQGKGYTAAEMVEAGLVVERDGGGYYDRFRGRLMFPIRDLSGHITGFGGRVLDDSQPKYLNSPQTPLFDKSSTLYGVDQAQQAIRTADQAVVVEGYTDVLMAHQRGKRNVVASLGTALTERQVAILKRLTKKVVLAMDPDVAGEEAALRGIEVVRRAFDQGAPVPTWRGLIQFERRLEGDIRILTLPQGQDPDDVLRETPELWEGLIAEAMPIVDYYLARALADTDLSTAKGKSAVAERLLPLIQELADPLQQAHYMQKLARALGVEERTLEAKWQALARQRMAQGRARRRLPPEATGPAPGATARKEPLSLEEYYVSLLLRYPEELQDRLWELDAEDMEQPRARQILAELQRSVKTDGRLDLESFRSRLDDTLGGFVDELERRQALTPPMGAREAVDELRACLAEIRRHSLRRCLEELGNLKQDAEAAGDIESAREFIAKAEEYIAELEPYEHGRAKAWVWNR